MTLRRQFFALGAIIVAIPILCVFFIGVDNYVHSYRRYMSKSPDALKNLKDHENREKKNGNHYDIYDDFLYSPPEFDSFLLNSEGEVILSTMPDFPAKSIINEDNIISILTSSDDKYTYQVNPHKTDGEEYVLVTRIPKLSIYKKKNPKNFYIPLLAFVAFLVGISALLLFFISRNLFASIMHIQQHLSQIAEGNLDDKIVTKHSKNPNEINSISENLELMRVSLKDSLNRKNKFIMGISHDLRTPIAVIKGYTEALDDGVITDKKEIKKTLGLIKSKISHLENMVNSLINFVKLDNNEIRKNLCPQPITKIINNFAADAQNTVSVFKRKLTSNINLPNEYLIPYDEQLVNRVFENLLSNALRYTEENDEIRICAYEYENSIYIKICDTGIGISESDLANIFDLFYRATNSRREEGMGIGLSVVKNIIETHGWRIEVESEKGKGSCFIIIIPLPAQ